VDAAVAIRDALLGSQVPTVVFSNRRAISAGALISLAADKLVITDGGTIGAATPVQIGAGGETEEQLS
jgi:membrane-bound serine protease (ClpP class)